MANELRKRADFVAGGLTTALTAVATTMQSPGLIDLPPIGSTEFAAVALFQTDVSGRVIKKEIVWVLDHVVGTDTATIIRGREGTTPQAWAIGDRWSHTQTSRDITVICTSGTRPVNPHIGLEIYENDTTSKRVWDGTAWQQIGGIPVGTMIWRPKESATPGYLRCDGSLVSRTTYADLFAYLGFDASPVPGTDPGSNNFYLPNTKGRVFVDKDAAQTEFATALLTGGNKASTAPHTHSLGAHTHTITVAGNNFDTDSRNTDHAHNVYGRDQNTNWMDRNASHWHPARFIRVVYDTGNRTHAHAGGANTGSEGVSGGAYYGANWTIDVDGVDTNHLHNFNHDHPSTNWQSQAPWNNGHTHVHNANHGHTASAGAPSSDVSGASSAAATSGNLQPYMTMVAYIKF